MKPLLAYILFLLLLLAIAPPAMAQAVSADSLAIRLSQRRGLRSSFEMGQLDIQTYTFGQSHCERQGLLGRYLPHLLPFQSSNAADVAFEAFSQVQYQWPGEMHLNITALRANQPRKARRVMRELYQVMLPIYATRRRHDYGSNKSFVLPFYDEGTSRYSFAFAPLPDTLLHTLAAIDHAPDTSRLCCLTFTPLRSHHTMLSGRVLIDSTNTNVLGIDCEGRIDLAQFRTQIFFCPDSLHGGLYIPHSSHIDIDYTYLGTRARNSYLTRFRFLDYTPFDSLDFRQVPLDLTPYYDEVEIDDSLDFHGLRPFGVPSRIDSLIYQSHPSPAHTPRHRPKRQIETFTESLISGSRIGPEHNRLRIYGPLDPASLGYDKFNGFTLQERMRWNYRFADESEYYLRADLGYAFGLHEMRFRLLNQWTYLPRRCGQIRLELRRSNSNFSSKFITTVNEALKQRHGVINFDSLGLDYYQRYEVTLQHSIELTNGLMCHAGVLATYRRPILQGVRGPAEEHRRELIDTHYADFAPFIRLEYTPGQYYWFDDGYKTYLPSPSPTLALEVSSAIPDVLGAQSRYRRAEFDMQQSLQFTRTRRLAYHLGFGRFFNQRGEYFINYRYFSSSQYPTSWDDDRIGGSFHGLDEYWYASSPSYVQFHLMYETPFGLAHRLRPISRFIIKERFYASSLWSEGKQFYDEIGYGIDNNYFNIGLFVGFKGLKYYDLSVKFRIEIGRHI